MPNCVIIANAGKDFDISALYQFKLHGFKIIALDGFANQLARVKFNPDIILGDFDSITQDSMNYFMNAQGVEIIHAIDQDYTDLQKAITHCKAKFKPSEIYILNSIGGARLDHCALNFRIGAGFLDKSCKIITVHNGQFIRHIVDEVIKISGRIGDNIAVLSSAKPAKISTKGLKYEMIEYELEFGICESTSNQLADQIAQISITGSAIIIFPATL